MIKDQFIEIFRYRVVYPGGTFIRISPSLDSEKTGLFVIFIDDEI
jgi:hypothetical protein